jgi:hypothetical protein
MNACVPRSSPCYLGPTSPSGLPAAPKPPIISKTLIIVPRQPDGGIRLRRNRVLSIDSIIRRARPAHRTAGTCSIGTARADRGLHFWLGIDDIARFNDACASSGLHPSGTPEAARLAGRYTLENDEHIDVLVARTIPTIDGQVIAFDALWLRRRSVALTPDVAVPVPATPDLILTKRIAARPKDLEDIRLLEILQQEEES